MRIRGPALALVSLLLSHCAAFPGAGSAGRRLGADLFVVLTSPVQIPSMASRDAQEMVDTPWLSALVFPVTFVLQTARHTLQSALYLVDLTAAPLHLFNDLEEPRIYAPFEFPMVPHEHEQVWREAGEIGLWSIGTLGGLAISIYFYGVYVPGLFDLPF